jgi:spore coat protein H
VSTPRRVPALVVALGLLLAACGDGGEGAGTSAPTTPAPSAVSTSTTSTVPEDPSAALFDPTVLHEVRIDLTDEALAALVATSASPTEERVPMVLTVDGTTIEDAGVRLKAGFGSFEGMTGKPGFSVKTDEFVDDQDVFGVTRFTLGNALWDHSFVNEHLVYELYRDAGIPVARTALARVTVNGETYGLYVMREGYNRRFLDRHFEEGGGNLYESIGSPDLLDTDLELRSNEEEADTRDLQAVATVVATVPPQEYRAAIEELVDVDELLTYWAIEALTTHWDGYLYDPTQVGTQGNPTANNFYAYHDPETDRFVVLPHGADVTLGMGSGITPATPVLLPPKPSATIAVRLWEDPAVRGELAERIEWVLDDLWDEEAMIARAEVLAGLVRADGLTGTRETATLADFEEELAERIAFITGRGPAVRVELAGG